MNQTSTAAQVVRALLLFLGGLVAIALVGGGLASVFGGKAESRAAPADLRQQRLRGVALYRLTAGIGVCARNPLHNCRAQYGSSLGDADLLYATRLIRPVQTCEGQAAEAIRACPPSADADPFAGTDPARARCLGEWGVLLNTIASHGDPRDGHFNSGHLRIECDEGYDEGDFGPGNW